MAVLLVNPPTLAHLSSRGLEGDMSYFEYECSFTSEYWYKSYPGEHIGLMALLAYMRTADIPCEVVNGQVLMHRYLDQTWAAMLDAQSRLDEIRVIGFSGPCQVFEENLELAIRAKRQWPNALIVFGHHFATLNYHRILADYSAFDAIVLGDGEDALRALSSTPSPDMASIPGLAWRDEHGRIRLQAQSASPRDMDELPEIARDELPAIMRIGVSPGISTSRGCPYRCTYCTTGQTAGLLHRRLGYRQRSIDPVVDEIARLQADYRIDRFTVTDDLFVVKSAASYERAVSFADGLIKRNIRIPFMLDCRLDSADPDVFRALADAGCYRVFMGVETGSTDQLAFYNKRYGEDFDVPYVRNRVGALQDLGIEVIPGILTYHPDTSWGELQETLDVIDACRYESTWQFLCEVFAHPGTTLYNEYKTRGWLADEWPVPSWQFRNPRAQAVQDAVLRAVENGGGHMQAREAFQNAITEWSLAEPNLHLGA